MKRYIDGGEAIFSAFRALSIDYVFSCPGSEWAPAWEAVVRQKVENTPGPAYLDLWHETVAVGMATGYALVTGRPQAVLLHAAPGLLQGTCAIQGALLAGAPMIVMSSESITYGERPGQDPGSQWYRNLSIVGGPQALVENITKWSNMAPTIEVLYEMVVRATEMSMRAPSGPTYLNVPVEVLLDQWTPPKFAKLTAPAGRKITPPEEIETLADRLIAAKNPIVLTETAGRESAAFKALTGLCDLMALPVIEPQSAVCTNFPRTNPMHQGSVADPFTATTDLVLLINCRAPWYPPSNKPANAATIVIDEVPQRPHVVYQALFADAYLEGEVGETLRQVTDVLKKRGFNRALVEERRARLTASHKAQLAKMHELEAKAAASNGPIDPVLLVKELRDQLGAEAVFVDESITHSRVVQQHLMLDQPERYYYVQGGLGQGIGVALGVKLASGDRPVVLTLGDGTYIYNPVVASLCASKDHKLPLLIVIFNNKQYLSMKYNHLRAYPDGAAVTHKTFPGTDLSTQPDLAEFAEPFGMFHATVKDVSSLSSAMKSAIEAMRQGRTAILNVMVTK